MLKIEINEEKSRLEVKGKGETILVEAILAVYVMARHFNDKDPVVMEAYRKLLIKKLLDENFSKLVASVDNVTPDPDTTEDDLTFM